MIVMGLSSAQADELTLPPTGHDWSGFYIGVNGGWGQGEWRGIYDNFDVTGGTPLSPLENDGGIFGGQIGYNWQDQALVLGAELELAGADLKDSTTGTDFLGAADAATARAKTNFLGSLRVRVGWAWDSVLLYGTGGLAFHNTELKITDPLVVPATDKTKFNGVGGSVGAGIEWAFWNNFSLRAQYLYYGFKDKKNLFPGAGDADPGDFAEFRHIHSFTFGANYHF